MRRKSISEYISNKKIEFLLSYICIDDNGCWIWCKAIKNNGYGELCLGSVVDDSRCMEYAHRVSYVWFKGPIPVGLQVDHLCNVRRCINPDHLEAVTALENTTRAWSIERKPYCKNGHARIPENTWGKKCKVCEQESRAHRIRTAPRCTELTKHSGVICGRLAKIKIEAQWFCWIHAFDDVLL
jgi:hypothetical protein